MTQLGREYTMNSGIVIVTKQLIQLISMLTPMFNVMNEIDCVRLPKQKFLYMDGIAFASGVFIISQRISVTKAFEVIETRRVQLYEIVDNVINSWQEDDKYTQFLKSVREELEAMQVTIKILKSAETI